jgi:hypothetical protein
MTLGAEKCDKLELCNQFRSQYTEPVRAFNIVRMGSIQEVPGLRSLGKTE